MSNRARHEFAPLIGNFSNHLLLRAQMSDDPSFRQLLRRSSESVLEGFANQDLPFGRLADALLADGLPLPRLESLFILRDGSAAQHLALPSIRVESIDVDLGTAFLDLTVDITETAGGLSGGIEYRRSAFTAGGIEEFALRFEALLAGVLEDPDRKGSSVPLPERSRPVGELASRTASSAAEPVAPRDELEAQLAKSWEGLLGKPSVGIRDDFFALGGTWSWPSPYSRRSRRSTASGCRSRRSSRPRRWSSWPRCCGGRIGRRRGPRWSRSNPTGLVPRSIACTVTAATC